MHTGLGWVNLKLRECLEDLCVDGRIIKNGPLINRMEEGGGVGWINLAHHSE